MPADQQTDIFGGLHDLQTPTEQAQLFEFAPAAVDQLAGCDDVQSLSDAARQTLAEHRSGPLDELEEEDVRDTGREALEGLPLGISSQTMFRVELSTGGPADWITLECTGDTPNYEPAGDGEHYEIVRAVYHYADWFDHAETAITGDALEAVESFARQTIPELLG